MISPMHNLVTVFDPHIKLSDILILLDVYCKNMNQDPKSIKIEVNQFFHDIYALYDDKIHEFSTSHL